MKERLRIQGLRKRWILNSVGPVILILVLAAILASATVANNYYGSARSTLEAKAKAGADYFNSYSMSSYSEYYRNASLYAASFDSTRIELQFLNLYGRVDNSTQGVAAGTAPQTPEIARALESGSIEVFSGKDPVTGESVMAVTTPLKFNGSTVALMRYVTATRQIDHQILIQVFPVGSGEPNSRGHAMSTSGGGIECRLDIGIVVFHGKTPVSFRSSPFLEYAVRCSMALIEM